MTRRRKQAALVVAAVLAVAACGVVPPLRDVDVDAQIMDLRPKTHDFPPRTKVDLSHLGCVVYEPGGARVRSACDPPARYPFLAFADEVNRVLVFRNDEPATLRFQRGGVRELQHVGRDTVVQLDYATEPSDLFFSVRTATHVRACGILQFAVICGVDH